MADDKDKDFENVAYLLNEAFIENMCEGAVEDTIKENADFHYQAGMKPKIMRTSSGYCCEWCSDIEGVYEYPDVPKEVWMIHRNCNCTVDYDPTDGKGLVQNVHTKNWGSGELRRIDMNADNDPNTIKQRIEYARRLKDNEGPFITEVIPRDDKKHIDIIKPKNIIKELNTSEVGQQALRFIKANDIEVILKYDFNAPKDLKGYCYPNQKYMVIIVNNVKTVKETAVTVVHETTHIMINQPKSRKQEVICFIEGEKHKGTVLTKPVIRDIIKIVNELYSDLPWRI